MHRDGAWGGFAFPLGGSLKPPLSKGGFAFLLFQIAEQILLIHAIGDQLGEAVNDGLLVLGVGHPEPLVVGGQDLDSSSSM